MYNTIWCIFLELERKAVMGGSREGQGRRSIGAAGFTGAYILCSSVKSSIWVILAEQVSREETGREIDFIASCAPHTRKSLVKGERFIRVLKGGQT